MGGEAVQRADHDGNKEQDKQRTEPYGVEHIEQPEEEQKVSKDAVARPRFHLHPVSEGSRVVRQVLGHLRDDHAKGESYGKH